MVKTNIMAYNFFQVFIAFASFLGIVVMIHTDSLEYVLFPIALIVNAVYLAFKADDEVFVQYEGKTNEYQQFFGGSHETCINSPLTPYTYNDMGYTAFTKPSYKNIVPLLNRSKKIQIN